MDISNMYLNTKLPEPEFMKVHISLIPQEIIDKYKPQPDERGFCYLKIKMAIYGLKQAGAQQMLTSLKTYPNMAINQFPVHQAYSNTTHAQYHSH